MRYACYHSFALQVALATIWLGSATAIADFTDKAADPDALPTAPPEFEVSLFARRADCATTLLDGI